MQLSDECAVPAAATGDSSDVAVALEVAGALWEKGDKGEAIRWLKRAIDAAHQAGDTGRAAGLARAAGDLEATLDSRNGGGASGHEVRLRVSVKTSVRDPNLLLLRPLPEGEKPPTGTREGFLVLAETEANGRSHANGGGAK
ncbi:MAG TPA: hypothetical protein VN894_11220 [Polyangiaceae bacterium]|nr:hypothetical protein [Polyangiaceae bacterium]